MTRLLTFFLLISFSITSWGFDDTVFDQSTIEDLDEVQPQKKTSNKPSMVLAPEIVDAAELPVIEQPAIKNSPPPAVTQNTTAETPQDKTSSINLPRDDVLGGSDDLGVVGTELKWQSPNLPSPPNTEAAAPPAEIQPAPMPEAPPLAEGLQPAPIPEVPPSQAEVAPNPIPQIPPPAITAPPQSPPAIALAPETDTLTYEGPVISVHLANVPVSEAIKAVAYAAQQRVIIPEEIPGKVTIHVEDRPWKWIIDSVLQAKPYIAIMAEGTLVVSEDVHLVKGVPIQQRFKLNHALPSRLADKLRPFLTDKGRVFADDPNSTLIIHDAPGAVNLASKIIQVSDIPQKKILIEAKLVDMQDTVAKEFGINWALGYRDNVNLVTGTISNTFNPSTIATRLGVTAQSGKMTLSAFLDFLETSQKLKVISSPKVITINNIEATLGQTEQFVYPIQVQGSAGSSTGYASLNADTLLKIRPRIVDGNGVEMEIMVKRAFPNDINHPTLPQKFQKQHATTLLVVKDGETAVIGGLKAQRNNSQKQGLPILKDIPVLGVLFGNERENVHTDDLMIFIQPKIL